MYSSISRYVCIKNADYIDLIAQTYPVLMSFYNNKMSFIVYLYNNILLGKCQLHTNTIQQLPIFAVTVVVSVQVHKFNILHSNNSGVTTLERPQL